MTDMDVGSNRPWLKIEPDDPESPPSLSTMATREGREPDDAYIDIDHPPLIGMGLDAPADESAVEGHKPLFANDRKSSSHVEAADRSGFRIEDVEQSPAHLPGQSITDVDTLEIDWPIQVKLERPDVSGIEAQSSRQEPEVMDVTDMDIGENRPWLKSEPVDTEQPVSTDSALAHEPITPEVPVKEEAPVVRHEIDNTVPILQDEQGQDVVLEALQPPQKGKRTDNLAALLQRQKLTFGGTTPQTIEDQANRAPKGERRQEKRRILNAITSSARDLVLMSGEERARHMESMMEIEEVPGKGRGVKASTDLPAFTVLGPYAGKLITGVGAIDSERAKVGMHFSDYLFGTRNENEVISAFGNRLGNMTSLVNKGDNPKENNLTVFRLGGKINFFMTERPVKAGEELLYDYGAFYDYSGWPAHPINVDEVAK